MINGTFLVVDDLGFVLLKKYNVLLDSLIYDSHKNQACTYVTLIHLSLFDSLLDKANPPYAFFRHAETEAPVKK